MNEEKIQHLLDRIEILAMRAEQLLPAQPSTEWDALAYRYRRYEGLHAIEHVHKIGLGNLLHIENQKAALVRNTEKFLRGLPCNHALLWGSRGTGKSTLVKALLTTYADRGLRLIEVEKQDLTEVHKIISPLISRHEKFILYCDDLSFEADESEYKALKSALDGSLSSSPDNVLIYATSNRRHLMPESLADNASTQLIGTELHHGEAVEEKISLSERFGLWLAFHPFTQTQYLAVVKHWIAVLNISCNSESELENAALQFALLRGSRSGRVARQFVNHWVSV